MRASRAWTLALAALLACGAGAAAGEGGCPAGCACARGLQLEYSCGPLELVLEPRRFLRASCRAPPPPAVAWPRLVAGVLPSVAFINCSAPLGGWAAALRSLGAANTSALTLRDMPPDAPLQPADLAGLELLEALTLQGAAVQRLPALLARLPALLRLVLRGALSALEADMFAAAPALERLEVSMCALGAVPAHAFRGLPALQRLGVWRAGAAQLHAAALGALPALQVLELRGNGLRALPTALLDGLPALRNLSLADNALSAVPALGAARGLLALDLSRNNLSALAAADLAPLSHLLSLNLDGNRITELPDGAFGGLSSVVEVSVGDNRLSEIHPEALRGADALRTLRLSGNRLTLEGRGAGAAGEVYAGFGGAGSGLRLPGALRRLELARNRLARVPPDLRLALLQLRALDLRHNRIQELTDADLNFLSAEIEVDLRYNNISVIELSPALAGALAGAAPSGVTALLQHNPLRCDCRAHELLLRAQGDSGGGPRLRLEGSRCAAPPALLGRALDTLPLELLQCALEAPACPPPCACALRPATAALELACPAPPAPGAWPAPADYGLQHSELRLAAAPGAAWPALPAHTRELSLAGLGLRALPAALLAAPPALLDLSDNLLPAAPRLLEHNATRLRLAGNPLRCDCDHADDILHLQQMAQQVEDYESLSCSPGGNTTLVVSGVVAGDACAGRRVLLALLALGGAALAAAAAGALLLRRYELPLRVWAAARGLACCGAPDDGEERLYDAFVSYSHRDEPWVLEQLVPRLEPARRLCLHFRDWTPGEPIPAQIARSVAQARRTLVVLSPHYLRSEWARAEWRAAHAGALGAGGGRLVVLLLGDVPVRDLEPELRAYLQTNTYVKVGDPWFWDKLLYALPRPRRPPGAAPAGAPEPPQDVAALKRAFDDRLPGLQARLTPDGRLVNSPDGGKLPDSGKLP